MATCGSALADGNFHGPIFRSGRQEEQPLGGYGVDAPAGLDNYAQSSDIVEDSIASDDPLAALTSNIPGVPGEGYPIFAEVPETAFTCEGQVEGGDLL